MKKWLPLVIVFWSCFALGSCKDVRLGASGVDAGGGSGGGAGNTGGVIGTGGTGGTDGTAACRAPSPDYGPTSSFERLPNGTPAAAQTCPAACGDSAWPSSGPPNIDIALPYGTCTPGTADCSALAEVPCACRSTTGPVDGFNCSCEGGTWICRIFALGTALCMPCPDGGVGNTDGADDAIPGQIPASTQLINLTDAQKGQICDWMVAKFGGYGTPVNCGSAAAPIISYTDQASCVADEPSLTNTPNCQATVGQMETCLNSISPCTTYAEFSSSPKCSFLTNC